MSQFLRSCILGFAMALTTLGMVSLVAAQTPTKPVSVPPEAPTGKKAGEQPASKPATSLPALPADIRGLLKQKIDMDFERTSLDNVLKYIGEVQKGLNIVIDPDVATAGIDLSRRVIDLKVKQVSVEQVLDLILGADLGYKIEPGAIVIKLRSKIVVEVVPRTYDTAVFVRFLGPDPLSVDVCIDVIKRNVNAMVGRDVASWKDEGGAATITNRGGQLIISQTDRGHERIANLLKSLASVAAGRPPPITPEPKEITLTRTRLQKKVDVNFQRLSLYQGLEQLGGMQPELNIVIDPDVASSGLDLSTRMVDLLVRQVPIETILKLMLGKDLGFKAEAGFVLVTTRDGLMRNLPCVVYLVRLPGAVSVEGAAQKGALIDIIKRTVTPVADPEIAAWSDEGGPASLDFLSGRQPHYALIVTQTPAGQERVAELLQKWRP